MSLPFHLSCSAHPSLSFSLLVHSSFRSETYVRVREASAEHWLFERAQMIQEFKRKGALPPPLNLLSILFYELPRGIAYLASKCGCTGVSKLLFSVWDDHCVDGKISRDGFRLVPGPSQQQRYQRRKRLTLRRCLKRQAEESQAHVNNQVSELHSLLEQVRTEARLNFDKISVQTLLAANNGGGGMMTTRSHLTRRGSLTTRSNGHGIGTWRPRSDSLSSSESTALQLQNDGADGSGTQRLRDVFMAKALGNIHFFFLIPSDQYAGFTSRHPALVSSGSMLLLFGKPLRSFSRVFIVPGGCQNSSEKRKTNKEFKGSTSV